MALSLALSWSPPPSSPLFDESTTPGGMSMASETQGNSSHTLTDLPSSAPTSTPSSGQVSASSSAVSELGRKSSPGGRQQPAASPANNNFSAQASPARGSSTSPQPRSYAAAASHGETHRSQGPQPLDMPSFPGAALTSAPSSSETMQQIPYGSRASGWASHHQAMKDPNTAYNTSVTEDGRRRRTTSGPQRSTPITYNDTLQHYPIPLAQNVRSGSGLPPGAMAPVSAGHPALQQANTNSAAGGYHPYRRTLKGSDASSPLYPSAAPPTLPQLPLQPALPGAALPAPPPRMRSASAASSETAREAAQRGQIPAPSSSLSYSSAVSGMARPQQAASQQVGLGHLRNSPQLRPTIPASSQRPDIGARSESGRSERSSSVSSARATPSVNSRPVHGRAESASSLQGTLERGSQTTASPASSSGRNTPVAASKKPSPLSRAAANEDKDDREAVYGGSDDENTIRSSATPTPGDKSKKNLSSKLKKALSFSTLNEIQQAEAAAAAPDRVYGGRNNLTHKRFEAGSGETNGSSGSTRSTSPPVTPDNSVPTLPTSSAASISSRRSTRPPLSGSDGLGSKRSLFNRKFNSSTDNISISSTVSSASVMLRKVGNLGKLARRSSLMGLTNMFNKDKEQGKDGRLGDDFGTIVPPGNIVASDDAALVGKGKKDKTKAKKGVPASASVSHATVELESNHGAPTDHSMTPAASYVRQHQLQMRQQAEADRIAREKQEAERAAAAAAAMQRSNRTTDDVTESRQKMIEKEKERLKSKRGWRKKLGVGSTGSTSEARQTTGLETVPVDGALPDSDSAIQFPTGYQGIPTHQGGLGGAYAAASVDGSNYDDTELDPPQMPVAMEGYESSGDDGETDSLRHWGEGIERSRESAAKIKQVKGILKNTGQNPAASRSASGMSSPPDPTSASIERPFANRNRANSYDVPASSSVHSGTSVPSMSQMSTTPAGSDRVDGVNRNSTSEERGSQDSRPAAMPLTAAANSNANLGHHANSSMPTLSLMMNAPSSTSQRSVTTSSTRKQLVFADAHIYHSTWPAHVYDRRGELATCNCLTPLLAQRIKEELNTYKMEEMAVAPSSRIHTHFFV